ncbi:cAMP-dependent kinase inhibitor beta [Labeo rohita]|uniref:cAMP-dependent kinase inhibitor beta n=2 Tax=Labeo rohita TaxID=84645 RepID=A0A498LVR2_LABRO|nr:cAMP-dependent protein kinase inhibitor beta [Labeo rohita]RXN07725.1 cAMP-dependent kinase inhibitor beta [Labeo rohita]RXN12260.1 cAMP-dependent kinase inhibitor beta [Labeo rohita]
MGGGDDALQTYSKLDELFWCEARNGSGEMTEVEPALDFASSGRSGRRNALPDILGSPAGVSPSDLPLKLAELSLTDGPGGAQSPTSQEALLSPESSEEKQGS